MGNEGGRQPKRKGTLVVREGLPDSAQGYPFLPGPVLAGPFHVAGDDPLDVDYVYGRYGNPTWANLEAALSSLEGENTQTLVFPSGSAAIAAVMMATLKAGQAVVVPGDGYPAARLVGKWLSSMGIEVRSVPTDTDAVLAAAPGASLVLLETPSNPGLDIVDVEAVAGAAEDTGARLVVDNTVATPLGQSPLELGAHGSLMSGSKHLTGHNDILLGSFTTENQKWSKRIERWRTESGTIVGPFEAWLAHRSLATLQVRLERQCESSLVLARMLAGRADVATVRYPGLPDNPVHELAKRQMMSFGTIVCFDLEDADRAKRFLAACELIIEATSFGGVHTSAERRARWGIDDVSAGLIRLSVGIEDVDDLREDLAAALDSSR